jgi:hypothetical protein
VFESKVLKKVVENLRLRGVSLYHACQLDDFISYIKLGGIPSRNILLSKGLPFTAFESDETDKANRVWDKVFGNFSDFGAIFHYGAQVIPNPYGPIVFKIDPEALLTAADLSITLRSAFYRNFSRELESLVSVEQVDSLFVNPIDAQNAYYIKNSKQLQDTFQNEPNIKSPIRSPEWSCTIAGEIMTIESVDYILCDPIALGGTTLLKIVSDKLENSEVRALLRKTKCKSKYQEIIDIVRSGESSLLTISKSKNVSEEVKLWAQETAKKNLHETFRRFAGYLYSGTLSKFPAPVDTVRMKLGS